MYPAATGGEREGKSRAFCLARTRVVAGCPIPSSFMSSSLKHQALHFRYRRCQAVNHGVRDDRMTDIQFHDFGNRGDGLNVVIVQAMTGMHGQTEARCMTSRCFDALQLASAMLADGFSISTGVQLDDRRSSANCCFQLRRLRIDEQRNANARLRELAANFLQRLLLADDIEATLGRHFGAFFRHQAAIRGPHFQRDADHLVGRGHFQVQPRLQGVLTHPDIAVLNVPTVLPQMNGDAVGARLLGNQRSKQRIWIGRASRLPERGDVVNVYTEVKHLRMLSFSLSQRQHDLPAAQLASIQTAIQCGPKQAPGVGTDSGIGEFFAC
jgi:hypothetical protein